MSLDLQVAFMDSAHIGDQLSPLVRRQEIYSLRRLKERFLDWKAAGTV